MAGGTFKNSQAKVRPGTYVNLKNGRARSVLGSSRGVAVIPLIGYDWGPRGEFITISAESPDANLAKLGRSVFDKHPMLVMLALCLMNAMTVYAYIPEGGAKAKKDISVGSATLKVEAMYNGTLGNSIKISSVANPVSGFDVSVYVGADVVETFENITTLAELSGMSEYVTFSGTGAMAAFAASTLAGGTDTVTGNAGITAFLDGCEKIKFNCMAFPSEDASLHAALLSKIKYIRENMGWKCQAVAPNFAADYEGIINLANSFEYDGVELTAAQATAWLAGATAGADYTTSLTHKVVTGATKVVGEKTNEEIIAGIKAGKTMFSTADDGAVILEYDCNSLVTITGDKPLDLYKNRPLRVYDTWCNDCLTTFVPGAFDNDSDGWTVMEGLGRAMLVAYADDGAITNVDLEADFVVDKTNSVGDSTYIIAGLQAVDSAEKFYITTIAR